jgi:hypothetical protein
MLTSLSHPEIAIGRYPVSNTNELNTMLRNLRNYTQKPMPVYGETMYSCWQMTM